MFIFGLLLFLLFQDGFPSHGSGKPELQCLAFINLTRLSMWLISSPMMRWKSQSDGPNTRRFFT
jgi:hypothetical protein